MSSTYFFHAHLLWHYDDAPVPFHSSCQRQADPCESGREREQSVATHIRFVRQSCDARCEPIRVSEKEVGFLLYMSRLYQCFLMSAQWWRHRASSDRFVRRPPPSSVRSYPWHFRLRWRTRTLHLKLSRTHVCTGNRENTITHYITWMWNRRDTIRKVTHKCCTPVRRPCQSCWCEREACSQSCSKQLERSSETAHYENTREKGGWSGWCGLAKQTDNAFTHESKHGSITRHVYFTLRMVFPHHIHVPPNNAGKRASNYCKWVGSSSNVDAVHTYNALLSRWGHERSNE